MDKVANASIKAFGQSPEADNVPTSEESVFILTAGQLKDLIKEAIQPLQDEVSQLKATVAAQGEKIAASENWQNTLSDNQGIQLQLINSLRDEVYHRKDRQTATDTERILKMEKLCIDAPKHEISLPELRGRLGIDKSVLSRLLKKMGRDRFYLRKSSLDKRIRYLCLRPEAR